MGIIAISISLAEKVVLLVIGHLRSRVPGREREADFKELAHMLVQD